LAVFFAEKECDENSSPLGADCAGDAGTATKHIHIGAGQAGQRLDRIRTLGNSLHLAYVDIDGGGAPGNVNPYLTGTLDLQGSDSTLPTQPLLEVDHVTIRGSGSNGVSLYDGAGFAPGSAELTIEGSAQYPIGMWSRAIDGVPTGQYSGNAHDEILLYGEGQGESIYEDATAHDRGVPYLVGHPAAGGNLYIGGSDTKVDFLATNTFSGIALCNQSYPGGVMISCPAPEAVPCPK
jgi:hypothetical protein